MILENRMTRPCPRLGSAGFVWFLAFAATPAYAQTAECSDGWTGSSTNFQDTCSRHGGIVRWDDQRMKDAANAWCDENPSLCEKSQWEGIEGHGNHR